MERAKSAERQMESALISRLVEPRSNVRLFTITGPSPSYASSYAFPNVKNFSSVIYTNEADQAEIVCPSFCKVYDRILSTTECCVRVLASAGILKKKKKGRKKCDDDALTTRWWTRTAGNLQRDAKRFGGEEPTRLPWLRMDRALKADGLSRISLCNTRAAGPSSFSSLDGL